MQSPKVSVIVPTYNVERYLEEALDSLVSQTIFDEMQVVLVDDGSTDGSHAILERYAERYPQFELVTKPNSGYGATMNRGIEAARGEYVGILEPDDVAAPDAYGVLYDLAKATGADVVKGDYWHHLSDRPLDEDEPVGNTARFADVAMGRAFDPADAPRILLVAPSIWSALYRRAFLAERGIGFLETPGASFQDTSFNFKALTTAAPLALTDKPVLHYRIDNAGSSVKQSSKVFNICDEYAEMWRYLRADPARFEAFKHWLPRVQYGGYFWNLDRLDASVQPQFYERLVREFQALADEGLLAQESFEHGDWERLQRLLADPEAFWRSEYAGEPGRLPSRRPGRRWCGGWRESS